MPTKYGRFKFLRDAERMGLDARAGFSEIELRRQRDRLMNAHHPDRGGSEETAAKINETYTRMRKWLLEKQPPQSAQAVEAVAEARGSGDYVLSARRWLESRHLLLASIVVGVGFAMLKKRR